MIRPRKPPLAGKAQHPHPPEGGGRDGSFRERLEWQWVCAQVRARGVPARDVDDVAQEVVVSMNRAAGGVAITVWQLMREARRALHHGVVRLEVDRYLESRKRRSAMALSALPEDLPEEVGARPSAEDLAIANTAVVRVRDAVALLEKAAPEQHAVLVAHDLDEMPMCEVAAKLAIRQATAWNRLRLGRATVREALRGWAAGTRHAS